MNKDTLLKIMGLFRMNLDKGMTILEISKVLKIGYRPAYNHIAEMSKEGIITIQNVGKAKQCFLNLKSEKARHILGEIDILRKEMLNKKEPKLKNVLEQMVFKLTKNYLSEIQSIVLFGSYAKGKAVKGSDIDLLFIVSDITNKKVREDIDRQCASFQHSHNTKISPLITDSKEFRIMLKAEELTVGKEAREYGIALYGSEHFWRLIA